jgi:hypothetical protein
VANSLLSESGVELVLHAESDNDLLEEHMALQTHRGCAALTFTFGPMHLSEAGASRSVL